MAESAVSTADVSAPQGEDIAVRLESVVKRFGDVAAVDGVNLDVRRGEFFSMLGPSGSGKTTCLRMIAGFETPTSGRILLDGEDVSRLAPYERDVNTVFQDYALFPHMTVAGNVEYGLKVKRVAKGERQERVNEALAMVQLSAFGERKPAQLSGGQRQRVALARALVNRPQVLLLDEPLGALDLKLRQAMQIELKEIQQSVGLTFIYVTHDQEEALTMSDRLAVFNRGQIEQVGTPAEVYERPATGFVAGFVGVSNVLDGSVGAADHRRRARVHDPAGEDRAQGTGRDGGVRGVFGIWTRPRGRIPGCQHQVHRAARRGGRVGRDAAEPHDVVDGGAAGAREGRAPGVGTQEQPPGRRGRGCARGVDGPTGGGSMKKQLRWLAVIGVLTLVAAACGSDDDGGGGGGGGGGDETVAPAKTYDAIGDTEGALSLIAWNGYTEDGSNDPAYDWVTPFEDETGCKVTVKYADTSDEMVTLMRQGGGSVYDGVSASGDAIEPADRRRRRRRGRHRRSSPRSPT